MYRLLALVSGSLIILAISWPSLQNWRSHGFARAFLFEANLVLVVLNAPAWFRDPLAWHQVMSWILLAASLLFLAVGVKTLWEVGKPAGKFENTTQLVTVGVYRYIRHPLYASLLFLGWGAYLKDPTPSATALVVLASLFASQTAVVEERENVLKFGSSYAAYLKRSKRFIPYIC